MILGRLSGNLMTRRLGHVSLGRLGGPLGAAGLGLMLAVLTPLAVLAGLGLLGLGLSVLAPLAFSAVGDQARGQVVAVLAFVTGTFQAGYLAGPALIAVLAAAMSLRWALLLAVVLLPGSALLAGGLGNRVLDNRVSLHPGSV